MSTENLGPKTRRRRRWQNNRYLYNNFGKESESSQVGNKVLELPNSVMGELKYVHEILRKSERSRSIVENNNSQAEVSLVITYFTFKNISFQSLLLIQFSKASSIRFFREFLSKNIVGSENFNFLSVLSNKHLTFPEPEPEQAPER